jgi:hypothetical protein
LSAISVAVLDGFECDRRALKMPGLGRQSVLLFDANRANEWDTSGTPSDNRETMVEIFLLGLALTLGAAYLAEKAVIWLTRTDCLDSAPEQGNGPPSPSKL